MVTNRVRNWILWVVFSGAGAMVGLGAGVAAMLLGAALLSMLPLRTSSNALVDFGAEWGGGLVAGLAVGLLQSLALNFMQRGTLTRGLFRRPTLLWLLGTTLAGGLIWWGVLDFGPNWLIDQWAATPDAGPSAALVLTATGLGAILGGLVGALQCVALIGTPRVALLWLILHTILCATVLYINIGSLPPYNLVDEHARDRLFGELLSAVFLALGGSAVLGGALLAWAVPPAGASVAPAGPSVDIPATL